MAYLEIRSAAGVERLELETRPVTIGRHPSNSVRLADKDWSRRHCIVECDAGIWRVRDLGSRNGFRVNGRRCVTAPLMTGDEIRLGTVSIRFIEPERHQLGDGWASVAGRFGGGTEAGVDIDLTRVVSESRPDPGSRLRQLCEQAPNRSIGFAEVELTVRESRGDRHADADSDLTLLRLMVLAGLRFNASAILIEGGREQARLLYRLDGRNVPVLELEQGLARRLLDSITESSGVLASGGEGRLPCRIARNASECDVRVHQLDRAWELRCSLPSVEPEVDRLLGLGLGPFIEARVQAALRRRSGLVLVAGPNGSGVRTTLQVLAEELERGDVGRRVLQPGGVGALRRACRAAEIEATLEREPDAIVVGRLEDEVAATVAAEAAASGRLVVAGVSASDTGIALMRLLELGLPASLIADGAPVVLAQRLLRRLCGRCSRSIPATTTQALSMGRSLEGAPAIGVPEGCGACLETGYIGRRAAFELLEPSDTVRDLLLRGPSIAGLRRVVDLAGHGTLRGAGLELVARGETSFEELDRVIPETTS